MPSAGLAQQERRDCGGQGCDEGDCGEDDGNDDEQGCPEAVDCDEVVAANADCAAFAWADIDKAVNGPEEKVQGGCPSEYVRYDGGGEGDSGTSHRGSTYASTRSGVRLSLASDIM